MAEISVVAYDGDMNDFLRSQRHILATLLNWWLWLFIVVLTMSCFATQARADDSSANPDEFGIEAGYLLPSMINGMSEVMPVWGLHYGMGISIGEVEFDGVSSHAAGSDYYNLAAGLRGSTPIFPAGNAIFFGGVDETIYRTSLSTTNRMKLGLHFGAGLMLKIVNTVWFRTDARFISGPGSILAVNLGLVYRAF